MDDDLNEELDRWRERLVDPSGRNPAVSSRRTRRGTLRLGTPPTQRLYNDQFLEGR